MYSQTYNMTPEEDNHFAGKTQNFEAVVQYQFDFGLRPSIGYGQTKGKDLRSRGLASPAEAAHEKRQTTGERPSHGMAYPVKPPT